jgi:hypothetical protein
MQGGATRATNVSSGLHILKYSTHHRDAENDDEEEGGESDDDHGDGPLGKKFILLGGQRGWLG